MTSTPIDKVDKLDKPSLASQDGPKHPGESVDIVDFVDRGVAARGVLANSPGLSSLSTLSTGVGGDGSFLEPFHTGNSDRMFSPVFWMLGR